MKNIKNIHKRFKKPIIAIAILMLLLYFLTCLTHRKSELEWNQYYIQQLNKGIFNSDALFFLVDFDGDDIPELIQNDGYILQIFKYENGKILTLECDNTGGIWPYGSGRVVDYYLIPEDGIIIGRGGNGPTRRWEYIWKYNTDKHIFSEIHWYNCIVYDDLNSNGVFDKGEDDNDGGSQSSAEYYDYDNPISKDEYALVLSNIDKNGMRFCDLTSYSFSELIAYLENIANK